MDKKTLLEDNGYNVTKVEQRQPGFVNFVNQNSSMKRIIDYLNKKGIRDITE